MSNPVAVIKRIPDEDRASEIDLRNEEFPSIKTLGIMWKSQEDILTFKYDSFSPNNDRHTKLSFLKKLTTIFDPLGLLSPFVVNKGRYYFRKFG